MQITLQSKFNDVQRPLFLHGLVTQGLLETHMHEYEGGFDVVWQIPFCGQGFDKHGSSGVDNDVVLAFVVVVIFALNK